MTRPIALSPDRLFQADPVTWDIARALYREVAGLPIVSPHFAQGIFAEHWRADIEDLDFMTRRVQAKQG